MRVERATIYDERTSLVASAHSDGSGVTVDVPTGGLGRDGGAWKNESNYPRSFFVEVITVKTATFGGTLGIPIPPTVLEDSPSSTAN